MTGEHQDSLHPPFVFRIAAPLLLLAAVAVMYSGCGAKGLQASLQPAASVQESAGAVQCSTRQSGPDTAVIKGVPVRQTAVGNDPDFGFASGMRDANYRYWALPSVGDPVKLAVVPIVLYAGEDNLEIAKDVIDKMPSIAALQDVFFGEDLAASAHRAEALALSPLGSLRQYFAENSNRKLLLYGHVFDFASIGATNYLGWYVPPEDAGAGTPYVEQKIGNDALDAILASSLADELAGCDNVDRWDSDQEQDGYSDVTPEPSSFFDCVVFLVAREHIPQIGPDWNGYITWQPRQLHDPPTIAGKPIRAQVYCYVQPIGDTRPVVSVSCRLTTIIHELGHAMGLPDTYDRYAPFPSPMSEKLGPVTYPSIHNPHGDAVSPEKYKEYLASNTDTYSGSNRALSHFSAFEKYLMGWIDSVVEVDYTDPASECDLRPITDGEMLVVHATSPSAIHSDWPLFKGSGPTAPTDVYLVMENRGSNISSHFEYNPEKAGIYGCWIDTAMAGAEWPDVIRQTYYNNVYRPVYFDSMEGQIEVGGSTALFGGIDSYLTPYTGLIGPNGRGVVVSSAGTMLPSIVRLGDPTDVPEGAVRLRVYPPHTPQIHLEEVRHKPLWSQEHGGDAYELSVLFWDSEFSHSWPGGEDDPPYEPSFRVTYDKLLSWDGGVDPSFEPIVSTNEDLYNQFKKTISVQVLLNGGLPGEHYFRATIDNLAPRNQVQRSAALAFSLQLEDPITIPGEEPVTLSFSEDRMQALFIPVGTGPDGGVWNYIEDLTQDPTFDVAYCGRTDALNQPLGYEPNLDVALVGSVKFKFIGSGTKTVAVTMRHQIEKAIPADNDTGGNPNWDLIGRPWDDSEYQVDGDRLYVEVRRFTDGTSEHEWFPAPYVGDEPGGEETNYQTYNLELSEQFLSGPGLDVLNADDSGTKYAQLRLRFVADDSVQFEGVFIKELVLDQ